MIYSVYDIQSREYVYYKGSGPKGTHASAPKPRGALNKIGGSIDQTSWMLPLDAQRVGSGEMPKGRVASKPAGVMDALGGIITDNPMQLGIAVVIAYFAWRHFG